MIEDRLRWDEKYQSGQTCDPAAPSLLMQEALTGWCTGEGPALDLACGKGRNAVWLAQQGYQVRGVDISPVALHAARQRAETAGVSIEFEEADLDVYSVAPRSTSLIVCVNFLDRRLWELLPQALLPGGRVFYQSLLGDPSGEGASPSRFRVRSQEMLEFFQRQGCRVLYYRETQEGDRPIAAILGSFPG